MSATPRRPIRRRGHGRRPRHADAFPAAQGAPPGLRPAHARVGAGRRARRSPVRAPLVVVSPATDAIRGVIGDAADYALQDVPRGTADAVRAALAVAPAGRRRGRRAQRGRAADGAAGHRGARRAARRAAGAAVALVTVDARRSRAAWAGSLRDAADAVTARGGGEGRDARRSWRIAEINAGLYAFDAAWLRRRLPAIEPSPVTGEYYLPLLVDLAVADGERVAAHRVADDGTLLGVNDRVQLRGGRAPAARPPRRAPSAGGRDHPRSGQHLAGCDRGARGGRGAGAGRGPAGQRRASGATASSGPARS